MLNDKINLINNNIQDEHYKKITQKDASNRTYSLVKKHQAPVAQLDRALGYGPGGSGFNS